MTTATREFNVYKSNPVMGIMAVKVLMWSMLIAGGALGFNTAMAAHSGNPLALENLLHQADNIVMVVVEERIGATSGGKVAYKGRVLQSFVMSLSGTVKLANMPDSLQGTRLYLFAGKTGHGALEPVHPKALFPVGDNGRVGVDNAVELPPFIKSVKSGHFQWVDRSAWDRALSELQEGC